MADQKQIVINDLMEELNKFGVHITNIRDAIQSKGVSSEGKIFKFAEEISSIEYAGSYSDLINAAKKAHAKGYSDFEIIETLNNLVDKTIPKPKPEETHEELTTISAYQFSGQGDNNVINFPNVTKVENGGLSGTNYSVINLPKATEIADDAFEGTYTDTINIPSFVWKSEFDLRLYASGSININTMTVSEESTPPNTILWDKPSLIVYNPDHTKTWDKATSAWIAAQ